MSFHDTDIGKRMKRRVRLPEAFAALTIRYLLHCLMSVFSHLKRHSRREGTLSILFIAISHCRDIKGKELNDQEDMGDR